jgi:hypothetical protein
MRQLFQKIALIIAVATLAACSAPQSLVSHIGAGVHVLPADTAVGHP